MKEAQRNNIEEQEIKNGKNSFFAKGLKNGNSTGYTHEVEGIKIR